MGSIDKVKVAVRVRPFNRREIDLGAKCVVDMEKDQTILFHPSVAFNKDSEVPAIAMLKKEPKTFAFDHCFWSMEESNQTKFANQEIVFNCLGNDLLKRAFEGYNACIFAYGQTGSGKSYSMMGTNEQKGIIPRLCDALFDQIKEKEANDLSFKVEVSYMEIYNEKVRDLLDPKGRHNLRVREHNILGPYVDDLSTLAVSEFQDINTLMSEGNKSRTVAATNMNSESSRSHAVFNIIVTQTLSDLQTGVSGEKVSKMSLVDLAGSERAQKTGAVGERLKEGSNINKSLTTLGLVISALADQASGKSRNKFVPYRDSTLTWLLKDNLGGNSKTVMIATVSPAADNYEETLSTLRYADRAKRIVNHAVVNEDPNARIIRELRSEVEELRKQLDDAQSTKTDVLREKLEESEKLMSEISKTWEEKLKETEKMHQERTAALEKMGISVETSGIKVEQCKYYLVNLNADPSLNELLVYYLKEHTLVGRSNAPTEQDIQLSGLGITAEHCVLDIDHNDVYVTPLDGARTCVNGRTITTKTRVKHGDRILWGNNHFFRINCPKANSPCSETPENIDYDFAQQELMMQQFMNDPIQEAITSVEKQHEEDKQEALERQRQMYERQMWMLRNQLMSPGTPSTGYPPLFDPFTKFTPMGVNSGSNMHPKYQQWVHEREKLFKQSLAQLKEEMMKANVLVREANFLAQEMAKDAEFSVTLQIPAANLSPNRKRGAFVTEPAILVKRSGGASQSGGTSQVWDMDKFENKVIDMRDLYQEWKEKDHQVAPLKSDPFSESQENHNLIGVANIFLEALFYDVKLDYQVPIINQQGEVSGRLHIELCRVAGALPEKQSDEGSSESSGESGTRNGFMMEEDSGNITVGNTIVCQVRIKEARGLPPTLANFVFCQYVMWGHPEPMVVPPVVHSENKKRKKTDDISIKFDHCKQFTVHVTEEFMEHCTEGALSIEVWGHSLAIGPNVMGWELDQVHAKSRSILDRWIELTRKIELCVEIHELSELGEYVPVEVVQRPEVLTGGVYQLRQGHSRRLLVQVKPVHNSGTLPIICESITLVQIGCVCARSHLQKGLDSYQEEDLSALREKWTEALSKRREYLDGQLKKIMSKEDKTAADLERERSLIDQWVRLTEERNAVLVPAAGSIIPGAPADWSPPVGMEQHTPVIFLDLNADDMSTPNVKEGLQAAGINSILPKEHGAKFYTLPFVKNSEKEVCAVISWDSSIHDSVHLNRVTPNNERICLIVKVVVRLSHPASMEVVLRKRVSINVYKRQSITEKLKKRIGKAVMMSVTGTDYFQDSLFFSAVTYEIVSNIPKASEDLEDRESLAQIAASQNEQTTADGETYIEKYIRGVSAFESVLTLDKLRQEVTIKELLAARGKPLRKSTSVPNINNMLTSPRGIEEMIRADSTQDIAHPLDHDRFSLDLFRHRQSSEFVGESSVSPNKSFNLASSMSGLSPQPTKLGKPPLKTLLEEQYVRETKPLLREPSEESDEERLGPAKPACRLTVSPLATQPTKTAVDQTLLHSPHSDSVESDDFQEYQEFQAGNQEETTDTAPASSAEVTEKSHGAGAVAKLDSSAADSLAYAAQVNNFAPSMASSGYASQAVSIQTLSSEDSGSVKSIGTDDILVDVSMATVEKKPASGTEDAVEKGVLLDQTEGDSSVTTNVNSELTIEETATAVKTSSGSSVQDVDSRVSETFQHETDADDALDTMGSVSKSSTEGTSEEERDSCMSGSSVPVSGAGESSSKYDTGLSTHKDEAAIAVDNSRALSELSVKPAEENIDFYSETAMEELERLSDAAADTSEVKSSTSPENVAQSNMAGEEAGKTFAVLSEPPSEECRDSASSEKVRLRRKGSGPRNIQSRRSLNVELESSIAATENGGRYPDIKAGVDFGKGANFKKLRPMADSRPNKSSPSPVKATYRPVSMTQEMMMSLEEAMQPDTEETQNSGGEEDAMSMCSFGSRADLHRLGEAPVPSWVLVGEPVMVLFSNSSSKPGAVQFVGQTEFASGNWVGVSLDQPEGKNDGSVKGVRYFRCRPRHGIFVRHDKLIMDKKRRNSKARSSPLRRSTGNLFSPSPQKEAQSSLGGVSSSNSFMKATAASSAKHK